MELTSDDKCKLLSINEDEMVDYFRKEIFIHSGLSLNEEQLVSIEKAIINSLDIELEETQIQKNVKISLKIKDGQIVVIKAKKLSLINFFVAMKNIDAIVNAENVSTVVLNSISLVIDLFVTNMDKEKSMVYSYLAYLTLYENKKISNVEVYDVIKTYYRESYAEEISDMRIRTILYALEYDFRVIEFLEEYLVVNDKIYFE